jgi:hypothetical protein
VIERKTIVVPIIVLAMGMVPAAATLAMTGRESAAPEPPPTAQATPEQYDLSEIKEDVVRELLDGEGFVIDPNQLAGEISARYPGGYGGYYFSEDDQTVYVYMLDPAQQEAAEAAVRAAHGKPLGDVNIVPVQGRYSMKQLADWYPLLKRRLGEYGVYPDVGAILEIDNRIELGFRDFEAKRATIESVIAELGIPLDAVHLEENYIIPWIGESLQAE